MNELHGPRNGIAAWDGRAGMDHYHFALGVGTRYGALLGLPSATGAERINVDEMLSGKG